MSAHDISIALVAFVPVNWLVTGVMLILAHYRSETAFRERASASVISTAGATLAGFLGLLYLAGVALPPPLTLGVLALALFAPSLPNLIWGAMFLLGRFR